MTAVRSETHRQFHSSGMTLIPHTVVSLAVLDVWSLVLRDVFLYSPNAELVHQFLLQFNLRKTYFFGSAHWQMALHRGYLSPVKIERIEPQLDVWFSTSCDQWKRIPFSGMLGDCNSSRGLAVCLHLSLMHLALNKVPVACPVPTSGPNRCVIPSTRSSQEMIDLVFQLRLSAHQLFLSLIPITSDAVRVSAHRPRDVNRSGELASQLPARDPTYAKIYVRARQTSSSVEC